MIDLARLRQAFPERHILYFDSLDSTQRVAAACQPGTIVLADRQLAGQQNGLIAITSGLQGGETVVASGGLFLQFAGSIQ